MKLFRSCFLRKLRLALFVAALFFPLNVVAQSGVVSYTISLASPEQHLVEVKMILPPGTARHELQLPVWNALYQIRDFAQYVNSIRAKDRSGKELRVDAINPSRWQVDGAQDGAIVEYQIYANTPGPFGAQLNAHHAFFNLAEILMYPLDGRSTTMHLNFDHVPEGWHEATPLNSVPDGGFSAENYDRLVDSPVELGNFQESDFDESGGHFRVIVDADPPDYDMAAIVADLRKIVSAAITWMDDRPFDNYMFLYHFPRGIGGGGMEHAYSTAIDISAEVLKRNLYPLTAVSAHEFFHLWNVKRIRPRGLEPVDYTKENYTRALWFSEGVTSTVENTIQFRARLISEKQYLDELSAQISELERRPAHLTQSVEGSSLDAWLEGNPYYRRPERSISYYNKGELLGVMLDLAVRQASHDQACLRDVLQWMNTNYAKRGRFFNGSEAVREAAEAVSHSDLGWFFAKYVAGTEEIPWDDFFRTVGLHAAQTASTISDAGFTASRNFDGPMLVESVSPGSEAEQAGLLVGDTIVNLQGKPVGEEIWQELFRLRPGDKLTLKIRNRGGERELKWKVGGQQEISYQLQDLDAVTTEQRARRAAWLKGEALVARANSALSNTDDAGIRGR
jgi:predicted metalloprotease with PDZ domain